MLTRLRCLVAASLLMLAACAEPPVPIPTSDAGLAGTGSALIVTRGYARDSSLFPGSDMRVDGSLKLQMPGARGSVELLNPGANFARDTGAFMIQVVPAGSYSVSFLKVGTATSYGRPPANPAPDVVLAPGDVVYLGTMELRVRNQRGALIPTVTVSDSSAAARAALQAKAPQFAGDMQTRLLTCAVCARN